MKQVDRVLLHGHIDPRVKQYWLFLAVIASFVTVVGVPFLPFTLLIAWLLIDRYVASIRCDLTERSLVIHKGVLTKVESTIPLTKITDLQMHQGPIMRLFGLKAFRVETAGQSSGAGGHLVDMVGIIEPEAFRAAVLAQRERLEEGGAPLAVAPASAGGEPLLEEMLAVLKRIEASLGN